MKSHVRSLLLLLAGWIGGAGLLRPAAAADGFIYVNVSIKFILHPGDGLRPRNTASDPATRITDASIAPALEDANRFLAGYGRGYRIRIVELKEIGGLGQSRSNQPKTKPGYYAIQTGEEDYAYPDGYSPPTGPLIDALDQNARLNATTKADFKWNDNAVNIFVPSGWYGGGGIFPESGNAAGFGYFEGWLFLHELTHYFGVYHTHSDDNLSDTLVDPLGYGRDTVAYALYGVAFNALTASQKTAVDKNSGVNHRAAVIYNKSYASLSAAQKAIVDNLPTAENWAQILYGKSYAALTATEKGKVDEKVNSPPYAGQDLDATAYRLYGVGYSSLLPAELTTVRTTYATRSRNSIAAANGLGMSYAALSAFNKDRVDHVFFNLMSYYDPPRRNETTNWITEGQCDRFAETANLHRSFAVSGRTLFVQPGGPPTIVGFGTIPFNSLTNAVTAASSSGKDILLLRPGTYTTAASISKPLTIRATRQGGVTIQKP